MNKKVTKAEIEQQLCATVERLTKAEEEYIKLRELARDQKKQIELLRQTLDNAIEGTKRQTAKVKYLDRIKAELIACRDYIAAIEE